MMRRRRPAGLRGRLRGAAAAVFVSPLLFSRCLAPSLILLCSLLHCSLRLLRT